MRILGLSVNNSVDNKFLYNNKEFEDENNVHPMVLGFKSYELRSGDSRLRLRAHFWRLSGYALQAHCYHYGVRYYDPQLGCWMVVDPADEFFSPYVYCHNDPLNFLDPDGAASEKAKETVSKSRRAWTAGSLWAAAGIGIAGGATAILTGGSSIAVAAGMISMLAGTTAGTCATVETVALACDAEDPNLPMKKEAYFVLGVAAGGVINMKTAEAAITYSVQKVQEKYEGEVEKGNIKVDEPGVVPTAADALDSMESFLNIGEPQK